MAVCKCSVNLPKSSPTLYSEKSLLLRRNRNRSRSLGTQDGASTTRATRHREDASDSGARPLGAFATRHRSLAVGGRFPGRRLERGDGASDRPGEQGNWPGYNAVTYQLPTGKLQLKAQGATHRKNAQAQSLEVRRVLRHALPECT